MTHHGIAQAATAEGKLGENLFASVRIATAWESWELAVQQK